MKIDNIRPYDMVNQISDHLSKKLELNAYQRGVLKMYLEDNIPMNITIDGQNYEVPYRYWSQFVQAHGNCCGSCNEETLADVEDAKKTAIEKGIKVTNHAWQY